MPTQATRWRSLGGGQKYSWLGYWHSNFFCQTTHTQIHGLEPIYCHHSDHGLHIFFISLETLIGRLNYLSIILPHILHFMGRIQKFCLSASKHQSVKISFRNIFIRHTKALISTSLHFANLHMHSFPTRALWVLEDTTTEERHGVGQYHAIYNAKPA